MTMTFRRRLRLWRDKSADDSVLASLRLSPLRFAGLDYRYRGSRIPIAFLPTAPPEIADGFW